MLTKRQKLLTAGTAVLAAEPVLALMHTGGVGAIVGLAVGAIVYNAVEDVEGFVEKTTGRELSLPARKPRAAGQGSLLYRMFNGKSTRGEAMGEDGEYDLYEDWDEEQQEIPEYILLADDLVLDPDDVIGKAIFGVGQRRSGKTTLMARIAEQIGYQYIPMIIPSSEGDLLSLYDVLPRGYIAAASGSNHDPEQVRLWEVTPEDADVLGYQILAEGLQVILDFNSFHKADDAWAVMTRIIDGLFQYAHEHPNQGSDSNTLPCPVEVFLDEAQKYLPQNMATSHVRNEKTRDALLKSYTDVITDGGKWGITPVIFSQRFAETNNQIMAQAEVRIVMRQTHDTDLERCKKYVNKNVATTQDMAAFEKGEGVFIGDDNTQVRTQFYPRESDGSRSHTPQAEVAQRFVNRPLDNIRRTLPTTPRPDSTHDERQEPVTENVPPRQVRRKIDPLVEQAAKTYLEMEDAGEKISQPKLADRAGVDFWQLRKKWHAVLAVVAEIRQLQAEEGEEEEEGEPQC